MQELNVSPQEIAEARAKDKEMGCLKDSIRNGDGNVYGFLGEILVAKFITAEIRNTYDFDLVKNGIKIDVKTKCCTSKPRPDYECSVAAFNTRQKCDYYIFVRILKDLSKAWLLGSIKKAHYFERATFYKQGQHDPKSHLGWVFKADCYNLPIAKLRPLKAC